MKRSSLVLLSTLVTIGFGVAAQAQTEPTTAPEPAATPPADAPPGEAAPPSATGEQPAGPRTKSWEDIVVVPRKAFLKGGRLELAPFTSITLNDVLIRHYAFGGDLNFYLTDVFSIGIEGQYFIKERSQLEGLVGLQYNRIPTLNRYRYAAAFNFGYVPGYGKYTLFNKYIMHWDIFINAGVGAIWSEIIPRVAGDEVFHTISLAPDFGVGTRFFLSDWLTISFAFRDYVFNDKFEPTDRKQGEAIENVQARAESRFVNNLMFTASLGFYLPTSFQYRTPR
ncbi:MAG TPA: outer membrane beta-barrel domain-containing protein [Polyangia bacterium]|nr:outer membrane beta-barrel domain-containing protein [Polyangia bacterium]